MKPGVVVSDAGGSPSKGRTFWSTGRRLLLAPAMALLMCLLFIGGHAPLAHAQTACLSVTPHILPQKNTIPTIEQLWITVGNGCPTVAQNGALHIQDIFRYCGGNVFIGLDETLGPFTWQPGQTTTPFTIQEFQTGCPPGSPPNGPLQEDLHGDASATGPNGQAFAGSGDAFYTFS